MQVPIIGFWREKCPAVQKAPPGLFASSDQTGLAGIHSIDGAHQGALTLFDPSDRCSPEIIQSEAIHFLDGGDIAYGKAVPSEPGLYHIIDYRPYIAIKNAAISYSCKPVKVLF